MSLNFNFVLNIFIALRHSRIPKCTSQQNVCREISVISREYGGFDRGYAQNCEQDKAGNGVHEDNHLGDSLLFAWYIHIGKKNSAEQKRQYVFIPAIANYTSNQTIMSTDIIHFHTTDTGESQSVYQWSALQLYLAISLPLMFLTFTAWYGVYWWVNRKDEKIAEPNTMV